MTNWNKNYTEITASQQQAIDLIKKTVEKRFSYGTPEEHELKRWEVDLSEISGNVNISFTVGQIGDEGTSAEAYCRDSGHLFIGRQGGIYTYSQTTNKKIKGLDNALGSM